MKSASCSTASDRLERKRPRPPAPAMHKDREQPDVVPDVEHASPVAQRHPAPQIDLLIENVVIDRRRLGPALAPDHRPVGQLQARTDRPLGHLRRHVIAKLSHTLMIVHAPRLTAGPRGSKMEPSRQGGTNPTMPTLTLKNIPDQLYDQLRQSAAEARRSLNSEILFRLEAAFGNRKVDAHDLLVRARAVRRSVGHRVTATELRQTRSSGRP
jgi:plasmid stability protein